MFTAFRGRSFARSKPIFWEWRGTHAGANWPVYGIRDGALGLVCDEDAQRIELYDLAADRNQTNDLATARPAEARALVGKIREWKSTLPDKPAADCVMLAQ